eukprot:s2753_g1.t1
METLGIEIVEDEADNDFGQAVAEADEYRLRGGDTALPGWLSELMGEGYELDMNFFDSLIDSAARTSRKLSGLRWYKRTGPGVAPTEVVEDGNPWLSTHWIPCLQMQSISWVGDSDSSQFEGGEYLEALWT